MIKYIDLTERIATSDHYNSDDRVVIREALDWLDEHPDQVPGPTITESRLVEILDFAEQHRLGPRSIVSAAGITVVPDPEPPTEAEKLIQLMVKVDPEGKLDQVEMLKALAEVGVKAPEGKS